MLLQRPAAELRHHRISGVHSILNLRKSLKLIEEREETNGGIRFTGATPWAVNPQNDIVKIPKGNHLIDDC